MENLLVCSVHFKKNKNLYGRYRGALYQIPNLHFELCYYQAIDYAIQNNLELVEAGAQGEHKISRGYLPVKTFSCHWFNDEALEKPISDFLMEEEKRVINTLNYLEKNLSPLMINRTCFLKVTFKRYKEFIFFVQKSINTCFFFFRGLQK